MLSDFIKVIKKNLTSKQVAERLEVAEDVLYGSTSGSDIEALNAVSNLTKNLCDKPVRSVFDGGFFVFYKVKPEEGEMQIFYKRLTLRERTIINSNPLMLSEPFKFLEKLESAVALEKHRADELRVIAIKNEEDAKI